jgi:hypothetical protein
MAGSLDIVTRLRTELPALRVPISTVASLAGISSSRVSSYVNGVLGCPGTDNVLLNDTWRDLQNLIKAVDPLILDYRRVEALRTAIKLMHEGRLHVSCFDPMAPTEWHQHQPSETNPPTMAGISSVGDDDGKLGTTNG